MKSCPTCKSTYSDDSLIFCLVDGSVLSAPDDPEETRTIPAARVTNSPLTEILPYGNALPPTITAPVSVNPPAPNLAPQSAQGSPAQNSDIFKSIIRRFLLGIITGVAAVLIIAFIGNLLLLGGHARSTALTAGAVFGAILGAIIFPISKVRFIKIVMFSIPIGAFVGLIIALIGNKLLLGGQAMDIAAVGGLVLGGILGAIILPIIRYAWK